MTSPKVSREFTNVRNSLMRALNLRVGDYYEVTLGDGRTLNIKIADVIWLEDEIIAIRTEHEYMVRPSTVKGREVVMHNNEPPIQSRSVSIILWDQIVDLVWHEHWQER